MNVRYWSTTAKAYKDVNLGEVISFSKTGKQNGANNYWTYECDDFTFKATCGVIHEGKTVYGMPVVVKYNNKNITQFCSFCNTSYSFL